MKKVLTIIFALAMIAGFSGQAFAYPNFVNVVCDYDYILETGDCGEAEGVTKYFEAGIYEIYAFDGGWLSSDNAPHFTPESISWFWGLTISTDSGDQVLGSYSDYYGLQSDALTGTQGGTNHTIILNMETGGDVHFFVDEYTTRSNDGFAMVEVTVVPEPISSALFVVGGTLLVGRRFIKKKRNA